MLVVSVADSLVGGPEEGRASRCSSAHEDVCAAAEHRAARREPQLGLDLVAVLDAEHPQDLTRDLAEADRTR